MATHVAYPVRIEGDLDPQPSRWLWVVKWFLLIPHYVVLVFLWIGFMVMSVAAFFAILFTGSYPRAIFNYNVGVMRWTWRVSFYGYEALATDRYPPFTLAEVPEYPAHLSVDYPQHLSRGLVLVKWWLLAIPHYIILGVLVGGAYIAAREQVFFGMGLIEILVLVAALALAFTAKYPRGIFDLIMGLNRWVFRVAAYAGLMTDMYPPFRLDQGGVESAPAVSPGSPTTTGTQADGAAPRTGGPGVGGVISIVIGSLVALVSLGLLGGGGVLLWVDLTQRDSAGFATTSTDEFTTDSYALVSERIDFQVDGPETFYPSSILGDARIRATSLDDKKVFIGIAQPGEVEAYLDGVAYGTVKDMFESDVEGRTGGAPSAPPGEQTFWEHSTTGAGRQELLWDVQRGDWAILVMNADASKNVSVEADAAAELPALPWIAVGLFVGGLVMAGIATALIVLGTRSGRRPASRPAS